MRRQRASLDNMLDARHQLGIRAEQVRNAVRFMARDQENSTSLMTPRSRPRRKRHIQAALHHAVAQWCRDAEKSGRPAAKTK